MARQVPTVGVLGVLSGIVYTKFGAIHDAMDALYPGIMTIGCAAMAEQGKAEVLRQHPELAELPECTSGPDGNWQTWYRDALAKLPETMELNEAAVDEQTIQSAFDEFAKGVHRPEAE